MVLGDPIPLGDDCECVTIITRRQAWFWILAGLRALWYGHQKVVAIGPHVMRIREGV